MCKTHQHQALTRSIPKNKEAVLVADTFWVNGIVFLLTRSHQIKYDTAQHCANLETNTIFKLLLQVRTIYNLGRFRIAEVLTDGLFETLRE